MISSAPGTSPPIWAGPPHSLQDDLKPMDFGLSSLSLSSTISGGNNRLPALSMSSLSTTGEEGSQNRGDTQTHILGGNPLTPSSSSPRGIHRYQTASQASGWYSSNPSPIGKSVNNEIHNVFSLSRHLQPHQRNDELAPPTSKLESVGELCSDNKRNLCESSTQSTPNGFGHMTQSKIVTDNKLPPNPSHFPRPSRGQIADGNYGKLAVNTNEFHTSSARSSSYGNFYSNSFEQPDDNIKGYNDLRSRAYTSPGPVGVRAWGSSSPFSEQQKKAILSMDLNGSGIGESGRPPLSNYGTKGTFSDFTSSDHYQQSHSDFSFSAESTKSTEKGWNPYSTSFTGNLRNIPRPQLRHSSSDLTGSRYSKGSGLGSTRILGNGADGNSNSPSIGKSKAPNSHVSMEKEHFLGIRDRTLSLGHASASGDQYLSSQPFRETSPQNSYLDLHDDSVGWHSYSPSDNSSPGECGISYSDGVSDNEGRLFLSLPPHKPSHGQDNQPTPLQETHHLKEHQQFRTGPYQHRLQSTQRSLGRHYQQNPSIPVLCSENDRFNDDIVSQHRHENAGKHQQKHSVLTRHVSVDGMYDPQGRLHQHLYDRRALGGSDSCFTELGQSSSLPKDCLDYAGHYCQNRPRARSTGTNFTVDVDSKRDTSNNNSLHSNTIIPSSMDGKPSRLELCFDSHYNTLSSHQTPYNGNSYPDQFCGRDGNVNSLQTSGSGRLLQAHLGNHHFAHCWLSSRSLVDDSNVRLENVSVTGSGGNDKSNSGVRCSDYAQEIRQPTTSGSNATFDGSMTPLSTGLGHQPDQQAQVMGIHHGRVRSFDQVQKHIQLDGRADDLFTGVESGMAHVSASNSRAYMSQRSYIDIDSTRDMERTMSRAPNYPVISSTQASSSQGAQLESLSSGQIFPGADLGQQQLVSVGGSSGIFVTGPRVVYNVKFKRAQRSFILGQRVLRDLKIGCYVKVEADRGEDLGIVVSRMPAEKFNASARSNIRLGAFAGSPAVPDEIPLVMIGAGCTTQAPGGAADLKRIIRHATHDEVQLLTIKREEEDELLRICRAKVRQRGLSMNVIDAEYQFDRHKLTFFFEAEGRVDFRELVRDLFSIYKTRIWMQQLDKNNSGGPGNVSGAGGSGSNSASDDDVDGPASSNNSRDH